MCVVGCLLSLFVSRVYLVWYTELRVQLLSVHQYKTLHCFVSMTYLIQVIEDHRNKFSEPTKSSELMPNCSQRSKTNNSNIDTRMHPQCSMFCRQRSLSVKRCNEPVIMSTAFVACLILLVIIITMYIVNENNPLIYQDYGVFCS